MTIDARRPVFTRNLQVPREDFQVRALMMTGKMPVLQAFSWLVVPEKGM